MRSMHFGVICPPVPGHLYPHCMLARELIQRGHTVTVFNIPDSEQFVRNLGVSYYVIGEKEYPLHSWHNEWAPAFTGSNVWRDAAILQVHIHMADIMLRDLPAILKEQKVDALLVDQLEPQGATLAEYLSIPFITICSILPIHSDPTGTVPCALAWWIPKSNFLHRGINKLSHAVAELIALRYMRTVNKYRRKFNLSPVYTLKKTFSAIAQIGVIPAVIDFPRPPVHEKYHAVGPFLEARNDASFPWERLDGRPIVYASLGTIRNHIQPIFQAILAVFASRTEYQLIISKGAWIGQGVDIKSAPGNPIVVDYAPQLNLLQQAVLCITHAGPGTVLECVYYGVPMVAIPIADDQPAMGARVQYHQIGETLSWKKVTMLKLEKLVDAVLHDTKYKQNIRLMSQTMQHLGGAKRASDIIENALTC